LVKRETPFEEVDRLIRYRTVPEDLRPVLDTWDRSFDHLGENATRINDRFLRLDAQGDRVDPIRPRGTRYEGDVRVLIGPQNSSATFQFADFVRRNRLATLIGEAFRTSGIFLENEKDLNSTSLKRSTAQNTGWTIRRMQYSVYIRFIRADL